MCCHATGRDVTNGCRLSLTLLHITVSVLKTCKFLSIVSEIKISPLERKHTSWGYLISGRPPDEGELDDDIFRFERPPFLLCTFMDPSFSQSSVPFALEKSGGKPD